MIKVAYFTEYETWLQNRMFDANAECNANNVLERYIGLREYLRERDLSLNTYDMYENIDEPDIWLVQEPTPGTVGFIAENRIDPSRVIFFLHEPYVVNPWGWSYIKKNHGLYKAILTWESNIIKTDKKFFHYHFPVTFDVSKYDYYKNRKKKNLCLIMHSNKISDIEGELYSFRRKIMEYFHNRGDNLLDVYGYGWNDKNHTSPFFTNLYKGTVDDKREAYAEYYYSFCIDNCVVPGYITYDPLVSMATGTVPIYLPMEDSKEFIPEDTFINLLNYKSFDELVRYLKYIIKTKEYEKYRKNGWKFLNSEKYYPFTIKKYCEDVYTAVNHLREELNKSEPVEEKQDKGVFVSPQEAASHLNPHFVKLLPMESGIILRKANPFDLLNHKRFDVMAKYIYVKYRDMGIDSDWAMKLYDEHIKVFNGYEERDGTGKKGFDAFLKSFNETIDSIKQDGFDETKSMIPVTNNNEIIEGSHRLAASLYYRKPVHVLSFASGLWDYDWSFFKQRGLSDEYMDIIAYEYCKLKKNTRIVLLFPSAVGRDDQVEKILRKYSSIYYEKKVKLENNGPTLLMTQVYYGENWVGDITNDFGGAQQKAYECFKSGIPLRVFIIEAKDLDSLKTAKDEIRSIYAIGNHSVHINDTYEETIRIARILLNRNSIHFLNHAGLKPFEKFQRNLAVYKRLLQQTSDDTENFCVGGSAVMALYGIRDARDIDYLHFGDMLHGGNSREISSHNDEIRYYPASRDDIIFNQDNHFYFDGIKFAGIEVIRRLKNKRGEDKDRQDVKLIDMFLNSGDQVKSQEDNSNGRSDSFIPGSALVSIIMLNHNGLEDIKICIESIRRNTPEEHEIIIVDNASEDGSREYFHSLRNIILVENPTNLGCPPARAQAMSLVKGRHVVFLDNDTVVTKNWLAKALRYFNAYPQVGMIGPRSNYVGSDQVIPDVPYKDINGLEQFAYELSQKNGGQLTTTFRLVGFCMFVRREVVDKIGCMDASFGPFGYEDEDYVWRTYIGGFLPVIANDIFIHHKGGPQGEGDSRYNMQLHKAWDIFKRKWGLPMDLPFGAKHDITDIVSGSFDKQKHYIQIPDRSSVDPLVYKSREFKDIDEKQQVLSYHQMAVVLKEQGKIEPALKQLELAFEQEKNNGELNNDLGALYYQKDEKQKALLFFRRAVELEPKNIDMRKNLADILLELGNIEEAVDNYSKILECDPDDLETLIIAGTLCFKTKQSESARKFFIRALDIDPANETAREYMDVLAKDAGGLHVEVSAPGTADSKKVVNLKNRALITGITGQDGSYLVEFLLSKGYEVHGLIRRASTFNTGRIDHMIVDEHVPGVKLFTHYGDLSDSGQIMNLIYNIQPDEVYNLGAQSHVRVSFDMPEYTGNVTALGTTRLLEAIRRSGMKIGYYQASSSEMFGASEPPQDEKTPFYPRSPYAAAKIYAYWMTVNYREGYDIFACNGILFNHESPRRGETFLTRKITRAIANILAGKQKKLYLGNLDSKRDWGFAPEYVEAMWLMLQQDDPDDYVIGTGESHSVREFAIKAFEYAGIELEWEGEGIREKGLVKSLSSKWDNILKKGDSVIGIDPIYFRPTEVKYLLADITKAREKLLWKPKITFNELVKIMVDYDMKLFGLEPVGEGIEISRTNGFSYTNHDFSFYEKIEEG